MMRLTIVNRETFSIARVSGDLDSTDAGRLGDALVASIGQRRIALVVDLTEVRSLTRAAIRGLVVVAKMLERRKGEMRVCGAAEPVRAVLEDLGHDHLMRLDPTLEASLQALADRAALEPAPVVPLAGARKASRGKPRDVARLALKRRAG